LIPYRTHLAVYAWVCHNILPSHLYVQRSCDRAEACCTARATWRTRSRHIDQRWSGHSSRHARPSAGVKARPGGSCKAIHDAEFGVGDSYHVMGSERDNSTARSRLAGNGMLRFLVIAAEQHRGLGTIRVLDLGDDTALRGGPPPHAAGPIKVSLYPASPPAQAVLRLCTSSPGLHVITAHLSS